MDEKTIKCPKCGHGNDPSSSECSQCGINYAIYSVAQERLKKGEKEKEKKKDIIPEKEIKEEKTVKCPQCANVSTSTESCSKCGIIFSKYYEIQAREKREELERAEALRRQKEEEEKAEALRKEKEKQEKAEALKKQKEEQERAEALKKQREEEEKAKALRKEKEEREKAEALRKQKEEQEKAEALRKQKEEQEKTEALRRQKEAEEKAEALRKEKEEREKAEALRKQKEEQEKTEALRREKEELEKRNQKIIKNLKATPKIKDLLRTYEGQNIGINYDNPTEIKEANLVKVNDEYFSIFLVDQGCIYSYPLRNIISVIERVDSDTLDEHSEKPHFPFIIQVKHLIA